MSLQISNGAKERVMPTLAAVFERGHIQIYSGTQPATADQAPTGTLLARVTLNGLPVENNNHGLFFQVEGPYLIKPPLAVWRMVVLASGAAGWWRLVAADETGGPSYVHARIDGAIGIDPSSNAEMILPSLALVAGTAHNFDSFFYSIPPLIGV